MFSNALEQSVNRDAKTKGGVIGTTRNAMSVDRWFLTAHIRAYIVSATKALCGKVDPSEETEQKPHKEARPSMVERDDEDVNAIISTVLEQTIDFTWIRRKKSG